MIANSSITEPKSVPCQRAYAFHDISSESDCMILLVSSNLFLCISSVPQHMFVWTIPWWNT